MKSHSESYKAAGVDIVAGYEAVELMKKTGIYEIRDNDITQASGGQLQRAAICRALINQPDIIFGDEPTGALNSSSTAEVMEILTMLNGEGATILLVTHDPRVAAYSDRVLYMTDGSIADEYKAGKLRDVADINGREQQLQSWLHKRGF